MLPEAGAPCGQAATQVRPLTKVPSGHELTQVPPVMIGLASGHDATHVAPSVKVPSGHELTHVSLTRSVSLSSGHDPTHVAPSAKVPSGHDATQVSTVYVPAGHASAVAVVPSAASSMNNEHDRSATGEEDPSRFSRAWLRVCRVEKNTVLLLQMRENSAPFSSKTARSGSSAPPSLVRAAFGDDSVVGKYLPKLPANFFGPSCRAVWNGVSARRRSVSAPVPRRTCLSGTHRRTPGFARCRSFRRR